MIAYLKSFRLLCMFPGFHSHSLSFPFPTHCPIYLNQFLSLICSQFLYTFTFSFPRGTPISLVVPLSLSSMLCTCMYVCTYVYVEDNCIIFVFVFFLTYTNMYLVFSYNLVLYHMCVLYSILAMYNMFLLDTEYLYY